MQWNRTDDGLDLELSFYVNAFANIFYVCVSHCMCVCI